MALAREGHQDQVVPFNWVNSNIGGAVVDGELVSFSGKAPCISYMDLRHYGGIFMFWYYDSL